MKSHYLITLSIALLGLLITNPANALQSTASIDMSGSRIAVTDLNSTDGITPLFTLSNENSSASYSWLKYNSVNNYFTDIVVHENTPLSGWTNDLSKTYTTPGATSKADLTANSLGTTNVMGYDDGYALWAQSGFSANFTLTGNTQVDIWIPVNLTVDPTGSNPTPKAGAEAYARTWLQLSSLPNYTSLAYDTLWLDHWTSGNLNGNLHVIFKNEVGSDYNGSMDVSAYSVNMSYGPSVSVPEPTTMLLLGLGLVGLAGIRRKFKK